MIYRDDLQALADRRPDGTLYCFHRDRLRRAARVFLEGFPGETTYAVKCNPEPALIRTLAECGLRRFDVASMQEIELIAALVPGAEMLFMHPIKTVEDIAAACGHFGIRHVAIDDPDELAKIDEADIADRQGLTVMVRMATPGDATYNLSDKFGASPSLARNLMAEAHNRGYGVGLCFHVGSQITDPGAYAQALLMAADLLRQAPAPIRALDIGGGFPAAYGGRPVPPMADLFETIRIGLGELQLPQSVRVLCEPGRAIAGPAFTTFARVLSRKGDKLFVNEGVWGTLSESMTGKIHFPESAFHRDLTPVRGRLRSFEIQGVTCDPTDKLYSRYRLPEGIGRDDWVRFDITGAYSLALKTSFNGFAYGEIVTVDAEMQAPVERRRQPVEA